MKKSKKQTFKALKKAAHDKNKEEVRKLVEADPQIINCRYELYPGRNHHSYFYNFSEKEMEFFSYCAYLGFNARQLLNVTESVLHVAIFLSAHKSCSILMNFYDDDLTSEAGHYHDLLLSELADASLLLKRLIKKIKFDNEFASGKFVYRILNKMPLKYYEWKEVFLLLLTGSRRENIIQEYMYYVLNKEIYNQDLLNNLIKRSQFPYEKIKWLWLLLSYGLLFNVGDVYTMFLKYGYSEEVELVITGVTKFTLHRYSDIYTDKRFPEYRTHMALILGLEKDDLEDATYKSTTMDQFIHYTFCGYANVSLESHIPMIKFFSWDKANRERFKRVYDHRKRSVDKNYCFSLLQKVPPLFQLCSRMIRRRIRSISDSPDDFRFRLNLLNITTSCRNGVLFKC